MRQGELLHCSFQAPSLQVGTLSYRLVWQRTNLWRSRRPLLPRHRRWGWHCTGARQRNTHGVGCLRVHRLRCWVGPRHRLRCWVGPRHRLRCWVGSRHRLPMQRGPGLACGPRDLLQGLGELVLEALVNGGLEG